MSYVFLLGYVDILELHYPWTQILFYTDAWKSDNAIQREVRS